MEFEAPVVPFPGRPDWRCIVVPDAPPPTHPWGRTPVTARIGEAEWETSTWRQRTGETLLMLPPALRARFAVDEVVRVELFPRSLEAAKPTVRRR